MKQKMKIMPIMFLMLGLTGSACAVENFGMVRAASAGDAPILVELYTSQGCSSCPPADRLAAELIKKRKDLIVLSLPVDYWDYLGWKDTLAQKRFSVRQRNYARALKSFQVYTPQMIIDGQYYGVGSRAKAILDLIRQRKKSRGDPVKMQLKRNGAFVDLNIPATKEISRAATIWRVNFIQKKSVDVGGGENSGARLAYYNVVTDMSPLDRNWSGAAVARKLPLRDGYDGVAVFIQTGLGPVLGSAGISLAR